MLCSYHLYTWGGKLRRLPYGYVLSCKATAEIERRKRTPLQAWCRWFLPDHTHVFNGQEKPLPPLRAVKPSDFSSASQKKRYSDWRVLCNRLKYYLVSEGYTVVQKPDEEQVVSYFQTAILIHYNLYVKHFHPQKKKRERNYVRCKAATSTVVTEIKKTMKVVAQVAKLCNSENVGDQIKYLKKIIRLQRFIRQYS